MKSWMVEVRQSMTFSVPVEAETKAEAAAKAVARVEADDTKLEVEHSTIEAISLMGPAELPEKPRVFVTVEGGVPYVQASEGVEIAVLDYDVNEDREGEPLEDDEARLAKVPAEFRELPEVEGERF